MVDYAGIFIKSSGRINKFRFAVLCKLHKKSRKTTSSTRPHMLHILSPAASASADRNSRQRDHMQIFPAQVRPQASYANFPNCNSPAGYLTKIKKYVIILKKTFFKTAVDESARRQFDKYKKLYYNIIGGSIFTDR